MVWANRSLPAFASRLERARKACDTSSQLVPDAMWRHIGSYAGSAVADVNERFEDWVQLRPPKTRNTYLVVYITHAAADVHTHAAALDPLLAQLEQWDAWVKLFVPDNFARIAWRCDQVTLEWTRTQLAHVINHRIYAATGMEKGFPYDVDNAFAGLLDEPPGLQTQNAGSAVQHLALAANGSLSKLLDLGNALLARPAQRHADGMYGAKITPEDLDAVLGPYDPS
jgi:hypothetical protein